VRRFRIGIPGQSHRAEPWQFVGSGRRERLFQLPAPAWRDRYRQRQLERKQLEQQHAEQQHD
jgi:hypothetical protein